MSVYVRLFVIVTITAMVTNESETSVLPVNEIQDCIAKEFAAAEKRKCFTEECRRSKTKDSIVPCLKLGYDLIYQDSSYNQRGDYDIMRRAHCAIDQCANGIMNYKGDDGWSGFSGSLQACLLETKRCVQPQKDEF